MPTIKEHYVPQFYLRNFTDDNGLLYIYNFDQNNFYAQKPKNICYEKNLYETEWEGENPKLGKYVMPNDIENIFCKYENEFAQLLKKINNVCTYGQRFNALILHGSEKETLHQFVVNLLIRNPINMEKLAVSEMSEKDKNSDGLILFRNILNEMQISGADSYYLALQKKAMLTSEFEGSYPQKCVEYLKKINFSFYYAKDREFITSDMPICIGNDSSISSEDKTCLYLALSPKIAVLFGNYNTSKRVKNKMIMVDDEVVDFFNSQIIENHSYIHLLIGSSSELIQKYVK